MSIYIKYPLVLGLVAAVSGIILYGTYIQTHKAIKAQELGALNVAVSKVFYFADKDKVTSRPVMTESKQLRYLEIFTDTSKENDLPDYFAVIGKGSGYNAAKPITLLAGFTNPAKATERYGQTPKSILVGWCVIDSEETPGLGEKIKDVAPRNTIAGYLSGDSGNTGSDMRTSFQQQFSDIATKRLYTADQLATKSENGPIDTITGATFTTKGVIRAIKEAATQLPQSIETK